MTTLSPKRSAILTFIRDRIAQNGQPPSLAEISEAFGFASRSVARKHIVALTEAGFIEVTANQARGIRLVENRPRAQMLEIPVLGRVAAGAPIGPDIDIHDTFTLDSRTFLRIPDYLLRVKGDSMIEDGIFDGDLVGILQSAEARDGQIVVARLAALAFLHDIGKANRGFQARKDPTAPTVGHIDQLSWVFHGWPASSYIQMMWCDGWFE